MLAITQPLRVGDWVTFDDQYGVVEDVRLNYTVLRTPPTRVIIPNEKLASGIIRNDTLISSEMSASTCRSGFRSAPTRTRALDVLAEETGSDASVAEVTHEGERITVGGDPVPPPQRARRQAELRARCLHRLRAEGLLASRSPAS